MCCLSSYLLPWTGPRPTTTAIRMKRLPALYTNNYSLHTFSEVTTEKMTSQLRKMNSHVTPTVYKKEIPRVHNLEKGYSVKLQFPCSVSKMAD